MQIDLHIHSTYSDGSFNPQEILDLAREKHLKKIALTDHDTVLGLQAMLQLDTSGIDIIRGIELDSYIKEHKKSLHILGYNLMEDLDIVQQKIKKFQTNRANRNLEMIEKLQKLGIKINAEELLASVKEGTATMESLGRPHFAKYLVKKKIVGTIRQAFQQYLSEESGSAFVTRKIIDPAEVIELIHQLGGKAFIAHPNTLALEKKSFIALLEKLVNVGLDGLEVFNSSMKDYAYSYFLKQQTQKYNLLYSAGSDFHGDAKIFVKLGEVKQNHKVRKLTSQDISEWFLKI